MNQVIDIQLAEARDVSRIIDVELEAGEIFKSFGFPDPPTEGAHVPQSALLNGIDRGMLWVAETQSQSLIIGFVLAGVMDDQAHLLEIDVIPAFGQQGIGKRLLAEVVAWARDENYVWLTLTTFRDVPWNGPFYKRFGFEEMPSTALGEQLAAVLAEEHETNTVPWKRCAMRFKL